MGRLWEWGSHDGPLSIPWIPPTVALNVANQCLCPGYPKVSSAGFSVDSSGRRDVP